MISIADWTALLGRKHRRAPLPIKFHYKSSYRVGTGWSVNPQPDQVGLLKVRICLRWPRESASIYVGDFL